MHPLLERIYESGFVEDDRGNTRPVVEAGVRRDTGSALADFVQRHAPARTLEIGMAFGISSLWICQALRATGQGHHTAIDPRQTSKYASIGLLNLKRAGLDDMVRLIEARSDVALPRLIAHGERFDFAFIDGNHTFDYVLVDFFLVDQLLPIAGHLALDDLWMPSVRKALSFILRNRAYELVPGAAPAPRLSERVLTQGRRVLQAPFDRSLRLAGLPGNVAFLRKTAADKRPWRFHRPF